MVVIADFLTFYAKSQCAIKFDVGAYKVIELHAFIAMHEIQELMN